jgi:hypothetical protein
LKARNRYVRILGYQVAVALKVMVKRKIEGEERKGWDLNSGKVDVKKTIEWVSD